MLQTLVNTWLLFFLYLQPELCVVRNRAKNVHRVHQDHVVDPASVDDQAIADHVAQKDLEVTKVHLARLVKEEAKGIQDPRETRALRVQQANQATMVKKEPRVPKVNVEEKETQGAQDLRVTKDVQAQKESMVNAVLQAILVDLVHVEGGARKVNLEETASRVRAMLVIGVHQENPDRKEIVEHPGNMVIQASPAIAKNTMVVLKWQQPTKDTVFHTGR